MIFEWMSDPSAWIGLATLVVLEIVLGIDNLVFIAILAEKLPPEQRDKARVIGLSLALLMRLALLASIAWIVTLTEPLFEVFGHSVSGRDLILLIGGAFLLFKATTELHERIEGHAAHKDSSVQNVAFGVVIAQIVVLDAVFSLDSVITAVGMVKHLSVMMIAVIIAIGIMLIASKPLMRFVGKHPTVVILCLGFLMMIGFSLIAEGLGFHIPKGYLYAAIGFSVLVEAINQMSQKNRAKHAVSGDLRSRTASAVLTMLGGKNDLDKNTGDINLNETSQVLASHTSSQEVFSEEEKDMIQSVLTLAERPIRSIMTPRPEIEWIDLEDSEEETLQRILNIGHSRLLVGKGSLDALQGVTLNHKVLNHYLENNQLELAAHLRQPLIVHENVKVLNVMEQLRQAPLQIAIILNEYGSIEGIATPIDILEAIAGEFPDEDEDLSTSEQLEDGSWMIDGSRDIRHVSLMLDCDLVDESEEYSTLSGYILSHLGRLPNSGEKVIADGFEFEVVTKDGHRIEKVHVCPYVESQTDSDS